MPKPLTDAELLERIRSKRRHPAPERFTAPGMLVLAARAVGKIDRDGIRGVTTLSTEEITAMATTLVAFGLIPIPPGAATPAKLIIEREETTDV
ncbi:hypothetical protein DDZ14_16230 [Maritimibacter sp. 55A14]|uniref:hypothetical protein n=1 Tax=Maritimibacter sp. 55A14 TaxID=2174844 RepID=UPI000D603F68|nr:hypothetical protein [Maritimibacter sp. 55A14]PWE29987.1 hypothetical protein DDZ14_16230 [Maritimibacter sp. 55A14]